MVQNLHFYICAGQRGCFQCGTQRTHTRCHKKGRAPASASTRPVWPTSLLLGAHVPHDPDGPLESFQTPQYLNALLTRDA